MHTYAKQKKYINHIFKICMKIKMLLIPTNKLFEINRSKPKTRKWNWKSICIFLLLHSYIPLIFLLDMGFTAFISPKIDHSHFWKTLLFIICHIKKKKESFRPFKQVIILLTKSCCYNNLQINKTCKLKKRKVHPSIHSSTFC